MGRQHHDLKIAPKYYMEVERGDKTFEVRFNDRNLQKYDILHLKEWTASDGYSGREIAVEVTYVLDDVNYCKEGYVIMSIKKI